MNETAGYGIVNSIFELFVVASFLLVFWILEVIWRNDRKGLLLIAIFPPALLYFIFKNWEETRGKCFFMGLFVVIVTLISAVTNYDYVLRLAALYQIIFFWPYYLFMHLQA